MDALHQFVGSYYGVTATDESATRYGEFEIDLTKDHIRSRAATGHMIQEESITLDMLEDVTKQEEKDEYKIFRIKETEVEFVFIMKPEFSCPDLVLRGIPGDYVHPTFLFDKKRFWANLWFKIKAIFGKEVPLLAYNGQAKRPNTYAKSAV